MSLNHDEGPTVHRESKVYLGDAVYVDIDDVRGIVLTTEDGLRASNTIYLEPQVINVLLIYIDRVLGLKCKC